VIVDPWPNVAAHTTTPTLPWWVFRGYQVGRWDDLVTRDVIA
jgi:hypothetical protein